MKNDRKQLGDDAPLSLDGILNVNHSYNPKSQPKKGRPSLEDQAKKPDGFYPQRVMSEIGKTAGDGAIALGEDIDPKSSDSNLKQPSEKPKKHSRFSRLKFWQRFKKQKKERTRRQKILRATGLLFIALIVVTGGYFAFKFFQTTQSVFHGGGKSAGLAQCRDISQLSKEGDCRINILLLGIGGPGHDGPDLTDTIMVASIDPINNTAALLSIPRDLWVQIPGNGSQKINAAYPYGKQYSSSKDANQQKRDGLKLLDQTLSPVIGMSINYHVIVDFSAFKEAVNDLGGITLNVPETLYDPTIAWENKNSPIIAKKGMQTMNGAQALLYARSRETSSDFARSQRQRDILVAISKKVLSLGTFSNPVKVSKLMNSFGNNVYTDLSLTDLDPLYNLASKIPSNDITSLDLASSPGNLVTTGNIGGLSVVYPVAGVFNYSEIVPYVRATLRDGYLAKENAQVAVYNATTTAGLATDEATLLKSYGYRITTIASAPNSSNPNGTIVVDLSSGKNPYTRHYLEKRFNTISAGSLPSQFGIKPPAGTDFVIILGHDASVSAAASTATN